MKTYLLLLFCTILQFLHAGWLFLHGLGTMPPDTAFVQVVSVSDAQAVLDTYENLFLTSSLLTAAFAALSFILLVVCMLMRRRPETQAHVRRVYYICQGGIVLTGLLLAGITLYATLQGVPAALAPVAPWKATFWTNSLNTFRYGGIINGTFLFIMAGTAMLLCYLRFTEHLREWRRSLRRW